MWGTLSKITRLPQTGVDQLVQSFFKLKLHDSGTLNFLLLKTTPIVRGYGIRFTPRSLLVGRFVSPSSSRLPCLSQAENSIAQVTHPVVIDLTSPINKIDVPGRFPAKPIGTPTVTVIYEYHHPKEIGDPLESLKEILAPERNKFKIYAARLVVIRRRKMKKHKLKKLRKKMKFEWAKVRQRREMRKEKAFQGGLLEEIRLAEKFNAEDWAQDVLRRAKETPVAGIPRKSWKEIMIGKYGRVLPH